MTDFRHLISFFFAVTIKVEREREKERGKERGKEREREREREREGRRRSSIVLHSNQILGRCGLLCGVVVIV
jgi:hypothetical protein